MIADIKYKSASIVRIHDKRKVSNKYNLSFFSKLEILLAEKVVDFLVIKLEDGKEFFIDMINISENKDYSFGMQEVVFPIEKIIGFNLNLNIEEKYARVLVEKKEA